MPRIRMHKFEVELTDNAVMMLRAITSVKEKGEKEVLENIIINGLVGLTWHLFPPGTKEFEAIHKRATKNIFGDE